MTHSGRVTGHAGARIRATIRYDPGCRVLERSQRPSAQVNQWSISDKRQLCISKSRILERLAPGQLWSSNQHPAQVHRVEKKMPRIGEKRGKLERQNKCQGIEGGRVEIRKLESAFRKAGARHQRA